MTAKARIIFLGAVVACLIALQYKPSHAQAPQPGSGNVVTAVGSATDTSAVTMLAQPAGAQVRNYITQAQCVNVSASTQAVALIKSGSTTIAQVGCPPASQNGIIVFNPPLKQPDVHTALTMTSSASVTTNYYFMSGFTAR